MRVSSLAILVILFDASDLALQSLRRALLLRPTPPQVGQTTPARKSQVMGGIVMTNRRRRRATCALASLIALFAATLAAPPALAQALAPMAFDRPVPLSVAAEEPWSWAGVPAGPIAACGVTFDPPGPPAAAAEPVRIEPPAAVVYALVSPVVEPHLAGVDFACGDQVVSLAASDCALVWAADPPHRRRLLLARVEAPVGTSVVEVRPRGTYLLGLLTGDAAAAQDPNLRGQYAAAAEQWRPRYEAELPPTVKLRRAVDALPKGPALVLPPRGAEPAAMTRALDATRLRSRLRVLADEDLLDPAVLDPAPAPRRLHFGLEQHLRTLKQPNDAADAVVRYLAGGGCLVVATSYPYPTYYALDAGAAPIPNQPLLRRLGIDIVAAFEQPPPDRPLTLRPAAGQTILPSLPPSWSWPTGVDQRLRSFGVVAGQSSTMAPLIEVVDPDGNVVGPAAALFELRGPDHPAGTILYVWSGVITDPRVADGVAADVLRWVIERIGEGA